MGSYAEEFLHGLWNWDIFPRWLPRLNDGLGAPTFYYYGPVAYYVTSIVGLVFGRSDGMFLLGAGMLILLIGSGISAYALFRGWAAPWPAAAGATLYMALPYHLLMDFWTRSAFAEAAAYVFLPLLFRGVENIRYRRHTGVLLLSASFALLILTHIITALLAFMTVCVYILFRLQGLNAMLRAGTALIGGMALSAIYFFPMLFLRDLVHVPVSEIEDYAFMLDHWWRGYRPDRATFIALNYITIFQFILVIILLFVIAAFRCDGEHVKLGVTWGALAICTIVSTTVFAAPLWRAVPLLANVQFPYRMLALADLGTAATASIALSGIARRLPRWRHLALAGILASSALGAAQALPALAFGNFHRDPESWRIITSIRSVSQTFRPVHSYERLPFDPGTDDRLDVPPVLVSPEAGTAHVEFWEADRIGIKAELARPAAVQVAQLYFGLWRATTADGSTLPVAPTADYGLVEISVPAGETRFTLALAPSPAERIGRVVSAMAALIWLALAVEGTRRTRRTARRVARA